MTDLKENPLHLSWHDSAWIPHLNPLNILEYFSERSNPFYDRTCNNEIVKMQKLSLDQLQNMTGLEYILLHVQEPILFVIRKQHRYSINQVTPLADYYIIAGYVYQAPDLNSLISSRLASGIHNLLSAFEEAHSYMRYHPTKGYTWDFARDQGDKETSKNVDKKKNKAKEETSSAFQRARVDLLLGELMKKFPPKAVQSALSTSSDSGKTNGNGASALSEESATTSVLAPTPAPTNGINGLTVSETGVRAETNDLRTSAAITNGSVANGSNTRTTSGIPEKKPRFN